MKAKHNYYEVQKIALEFSKQGKTIKVIADELDVKVSTVEKWLKQVNTIKVKTIDEYINNLKNTKLFITKLLLGKKSDEAIIKELQEKGTGKASQAYLTMAKRDLDKFYNGTLRIKVKKVKVAKVKKTKVAKGEYVEVDCPYKEEFSRGRYVNVLPIDGKLFVDLASKSAKSAIAIHKRCKEAKIVVPEMNPLVCKELKKNKKTNGWDYMQLFEGKLGDALKMYVKDSLEGINADYCKTLGKFKGDMIDIFTTHYVKVGCYVGMTFACGRRMSNDQAIENLQSFLDQYSANYKIVAEIVRYKSNGRKSPMITCVVQRIK